MKKLLVMMVMALLAAYGIAGADASVPTGPREGLTLMAAPAVGGGGKTGSRLGVGYIGDFHGVEGLVCGDELSLFRGHYVTRGANPDVDLWEVRALSTAKYLLVPTSAITPYISGGLGASYVHQHGVKGSGGDLAFAYQGGAGVAFTVPFGQIDLGYRYDGTSHVDGGALGVHSVGVTVGIPVDF